MGIAIANMINIFDPARVLICGDGLRVGNLLLEPLRAAIPIHSFGPFPPISPIVHPIDETNWTRGAASLILREIFQPPIYESEEPLAIDELLSQASSLHRRKG
ncbi:MAG: ROK family protein [Chloroflexi bacterium]|nr:MAG: ROK family protein [Chloroflexota bacterium]